MTDNTFDDDNDPYGYKEHIARLEKERVWVPLFTAAVGLVAYYFKGGEFSEAEQTILTAVALGVWAVFNEVRTTRIEALKYQARKEGTKLKAWKR